MCIRDRALAIAACGGDSEPERVARGDASPGTVPTSAPDNADSDSEPTEATDADSTGSGDDSLPPEVTEPTDEAPVDSIPGDTTADPPDNVEDPDPGTTEPGAEPVVFTGNPGAVIPVTGPGDIDANGDVRGSIDAAGQVDIYTFEAVSYTHLTLPTTPYV